MQLSPIVEQVINNYFKALMTNMLTSLSNRVNSAWLNYNYIYFLGKESRNHRVSSCRNVICNYEVFNFQNKLMRLSDNTTKREDATPTNQPFYQ